MMALIRTILLLKWFSQTLLCFRSLSCPQCRQKLKGQKATKLFFSIPDQDTFSQEDPSALHNKLQCINFQMKLKNTDIKNLKQDIDKVNTQNKGLKYVQYIELQLNNILQYIRLLTLRDLSNGTNIVCLANMLSQTDLLTPLNT